MGKAKIKSNDGRSYSGYLFVLPNFVGFLVFMLLPILAALILAFVKWDMLSPMEFVGFANFKKLFSEPDFWKYSYNTIFLMLVIPAQMLGSLFLAIALNQKLKGIVAFRTIYFLPTICAGVALLILWKWIYDYENGLFNMMLARLGIEGPNWLGSVTWAKPAIMTMTFWTAVGGQNMILYLASLQGISPDLYEAADIDGASQWQRFWSITWPLVSPTTFFIFITSVIGGFQGGFEAAYILTKGGPAGATTTISYYIYNHAYQWFNMGYASAVSWVLFIAVFIATAINWKFGGKRVVY